MILPKKFMKLWSAIVAHCRSAKNMKLRVKCTKKSSSNDCQTNEYSGNSENWEKM